MTFGRFNELNHEHALNYKWPTGDGYQWYLQAPGKGLLTGNTPQLGACICWWYQDVDPPHDPTGHTAIVEEIFYDAYGNWTHLTTSNSAWERPAGTPVEGFPYFYTRTIYRSSIDYVPNHPEAYCQGFVYHPKFPPDVNPLNKGSLLSIISRNDRKGVKIIKRRRY